MTSIKKKAALVKIFEQEFEKLPIFILPGGALKYLEYKILPTPVGTWRVTNNSKTIAEYSLRASALVAAYYDSTKKYKKIADLRLYDQNYAINATDAALFSQRLKRATDLDRIDMLLARLDVAKTRADYNKKKITAMFNTAFDK